jgi:hypothetical protein
MLRARARSAARTPVAETLFVTEAASGVSALATVGGRNVRVLLVRPPSIVLLREVFVPRGESVRSVRGARTVAS